MSPGRSYLYQRVWERSRIDQSERPHPPQDHESMFLHNRHNTHRHDHPVPEQEHRIWKCQHLVQRGKKLDMEINRERKGRRQCQHRQHKKTSVNRTCVPSVQFFMIRLPMRWSNGLRGQGRSRNMLEFTLQIVYIRYSSHLLFIISRKTATTL